MEDVRYIADETFPSFLANSLTSRTSENWDNITIASDLGLPVAASTEARQKTGSHERLCDQASYMDERLAVPSPLSNSVESTSDPRKKLALILQDIIGDCNNPVETFLESAQKEESNSLQKRKNPNGNDEYLENSCNSLCEIPPLEHMEDLTSGILSFSGRNNQDGKASSFGLGQKRTKDIVDDNDMTGLSSLIENEKLLTFASLEDRSSDDDIGGKEFCDDQLEAYFEKLALPEMEVDNIEQDEPDRCIKGMELLPEEDKFQVLNVCQPATRMDSPVVSDEDLHEFMEAEHIVNDQQFRLPIMAKEKEDGCPAPEENLLQNNRPHEPFERDRLTPEIPTSTKDLQLIHSRVGGFLDCNNEDETTLRAHTFINGRNVRGEDTENHVSTEDASYDRDVSNITSCAQLKIDSVYFKCTDGNNAASTLWHTEEQAQFSYLNEVANENNLPLADEYLSPSTYQRSEDPSHNIVYQNEEGRWVTDLAYYTSFNKEEVSSPLNTSESFISGSKALGMIAKDQEAFEREHRFMQEEQMDSQNTSGLGDTSWKSVSSCNALRASQAQDFSKDARYLRLSLGEFFGQRSEALGCLGGNGGVKRPSFGYQITSPEKRQPVALFSESSVSRANTDEPSEQHSVVLQGNSEDSINGKSYAASATFICGEKDRLASKKRSINTQMNTRNKTQEKSGKGGVESGHPELKPSVLSISTIASAIANASVSAEPSQLAAMIMACLNNSREGTNVLEAGKPADLSVISQCLASNVEKSIFDMEKYFRKTEENENDTFENCFNHEDISRDWQKSFYKQEPEITPTGDLSKSNLYSKHGEERCHLESEYEELCSKGLSCDTATSEKKNSTRYLDPSLRSVYSTDDNLQSKRSASIALCSKERSGCAEVLLDGSSTKITSSAYSEPEGRTIANTSCLNLKAGSVLVSSLPECPHKEEVTHEDQYKNKQDGRILKNNPACSTEKHVTFEESPVDNQKPIGKYKYSSG